MSMKRKQGLPKFKMKSKLLFVIIIFFIDLQTKQIGKVKSRTDK